MANMRYNEIDRNFPVAGRPNESQGFRDNFNAIQESLQYCDTEITDLKETTVKLGVENVFDDNATLSNVKLVNQSEEVFKTSSAVNANVEVDYTLGSYQYLKLKNNVTLTLKGWPTVSSAEGGRFTKLRLELVRDASSETDNNLTSVTVAFSSSDSAIQYSDNWPTTFTLSSTTAPVVVEFWTWDKSVGIYANYLGQYGNSVRTTVVNNLTIKGNTAIGDSVADKVEFTAIPRLPLLTTVQRDDLVAEPGMIIFNTSTKKVQACTEIVNNSPVWVDLS